MPNFVCCKFFCISQALKHLRTAQFCPLVIFIKPQSTESVRRLHRSARVDKQGGFSGLDVSIVQLYDIVGEASNKGTMKRSIN